nr:hypothetical protein [Sodalis-like endosymbiont of Proechinophthirus fluctus]
MRSSAALLQAAPCIAEHLPGDIIHYHLLLVERRIKDNGLHTVIRDAR